MCFPPRRCGSRPAARGPAQIEASRKFWGVPKFDLLQVHNLLAWEEHLRTLFAMKAAGQVRYVGITTSEGRRHGDVEKIMRAHPLDFVQVSYNVLDREVENRILPLARERGIAVIINRPFREGDLVKTIMRKPLPPFAAEIGATELGAADPQIHHLESGGDLRRSRRPRGSITCRRTSRAARDPLPDAAMRARIVAHVEKL